MSKAQAKEQPEAGTLPEAAAGLGLPYIHRRLLKNSLAASDYGLLGSVK